MWNIEGPEAEILWNEAYAILSKVKVPLLAIQPEDGLTIDGPFCWINSKGLPGEEVAYAIYPSDSEHPIIAALDGLHSEFQICYRASMGRTGFNSILPAIWGAEERAVWFRAACNNQWNNLALKLYESGFDNKSPALDGSRPLFWASWLGNRELVSNMLNAGADPNARDESFENYVPLVAASVKGHKEIVSLLLEKGAKVNQDIWKGISNFELVFSKLSPEILKLLQDSERAQSKKQPPNDN
jgi:ankyrin repeat protein